MMMEHQNFKIVVTGLDKDSTEWDVLHLFYKYGLIRNIRVHKNMAFVEMCDKKGYDNILEEAVDGKIVVDGKELTVKANQVKQVLDEPFAPVYEMHDDFYCSDDRVFNEKVYLNEFDGTKSDIKFNFWVPLVYNDKNLKKKLETEFNKCKSHKIAVNSFVIVKRCDEFERGQVMRRLNNGAYVVFFVDRGFVTAVRAENLRTLVNEELLEPRFKASLCTLNNIGNIRGAFINEFLSLICANPASIGYKIKLIGFEGFISRVNIAIVDKDNNEHDLGLMLADKGVCDLINCEKVEEDKENINCKVVMEKPIVIYKYSSSQMKSIEENEANFIKMIQEIKISKDSLNNVYNNKRPSKKVN
uniref:RRM domain-containing protein n=1 Tax=Parastrongyloides trichosuri TaxID=131310 RepID=A0A0N5A2P2_PARTI